jgi:hypothetical protein
MFKNHSRQLVLLFGFGVGTLTSQSSLVTITEILDATYYEKNILIIGFDILFHSNTISQIPDLTIDCLLNNQYILNENGFCIQETKKNSFCVLLKNYDIPMESVNNVINIFARQCIKSHNIENYMTTMLNKTQMTNKKIEFVDMLTSYVVKYNPYEIIFMNDLKFNTRGYVYNNVIFSTTLEFLTEDDILFCQQNNIALPNRSCPVQYGAFYDSNFMFSETPSIIYCMLTLNKKYSVNMIEFIGEKWTIFKI